MIQTGKTYFLSRPRRFGKSLLVSTLEALFSGKKELFRGLWIETSDYIWKEYPVIALDFSRIFSSNLKEMKESLNELLQEIANRYDKKLIVDENPARTLSRLVLSLSQNTQVVILIDEYDKPILDHIHDEKLLKAYREVFKAFFANIKALGKHFRFSFITGVTKFSQVSLFSGMNNPEDISFQHPYGALVGITENELERYFASRIESIEGNDQEIRKMLKAWYNGYRFSGHPDCESVYNPLSLMSFLKSKRLSNYWFATATPTFAYEMIKKNNYVVADFERPVVVGNGIEMNHEIDSIDLITLLYQTGYLTITSYDKKAQRYELQFPNEEVRRSFFEHLFLHFSDLKEYQVNQTLITLEKSLIQGDFEGFFSAFNLIIAAVPHAIHLPTESYYHSLIYLLLKMLGYNVHAEVMTAGGRLDMVVHLEKQVLIFEFKIDGSSTGAIEQIREKNYGAAFKGPDRTVVLIGVNIDRKKRCVGSWKSDML